MLINQNNKKRFSTKATISGVSNISTQLMDFPTQGRYNLSKVFPPVLFYSIQGE